MGGGTSWAGPPPGVGASFWGGPLRRGAGILLGLSLLVVGQTPLSRSATSDHSTYPALLHSAAATRACSSRCDPQSWL